MDFSRYRHGIRFFERHFLHAEEFAFVEMRFRFRKPRREIHVEFFVRVRGGGIDGSYKFEFIRFEPRFFLELAYGASKRLLAFFTSAA